MPPSSRGLGHLPFTEATGIRIPLGVYRYSCLGKKELGGLRPPFSVFTQDVRGDPLLILAGIRSDLDQG